MGWRGSMTSNRPARFGSKVRNRSSYPTMSSFKRRQPAAQVLQTPGTRLVPGSSSLLQISTGIPSLDDILGGGLPLGHVFTILAPDVHSAWGELVSRYYVSQGLATDQAVCLVEDNPNVFLEACMWLPGASRSKSELGHETTQLEEHEESHKGEEVKIAWRYEKMEQFRTTVDHDSSDCMFSTHWYPGYHMNKSI